MSDVDVKKDLHNLHDGDVAEATVAECRRWWRSTCRCAQRTVVRFA